MARFHINFPLTLKLLPLKPNGLRSRTGPSGRGAGAGVDSAWEQEKLEARKMFENAAESPVSSVSMKTQSDGVAVGHVFGYAMNVE